MIILNDFLPFSCPACRQSFCQPHFLPSQHACSAPLPAGMVDRIAPQCPLCNEIVPTTASRDPNEAVERHLLSETCTGLPGGEELLDGVHVESVPASACVGGDPGLVSRVLAQRAEAKALGLQPGHQRLQDRRRPGVLAGPDAQMRDEDIAGPDVTQGLGQ